jgi:hypothetical protein
VGALCETPATKATARAGAPTNSFSSVPWPRIAADDRERDVADLSRGANSATLVDDYTASVGHDACKSTSTKWVEPLIPTNAAAPFHPNARGEAGIAAVVAAAVGA